VFFVFSFGVVQQQEGDIFSTLAECQHQAAYYNRMIAEAHNPTMTAKCFGRRPTWTAQ
jgi:hypothetical protein